MAAEGGESAAVDQNPAWITEPGASRGVDDTEGLPPPSGKRRGCPVLYPGLGMNLTPQPPLWALGARAPGIFPQAPKGDAAGPGWSRALSLCPCGMWDRPALGNQRCRHGTALAGCWCLPLQQCSYF